MCDAMYFVVVTVCCVIVGILSTWDLTPLCTWDTEDNPGTPGILSTWDLTPLCTWDTEDNPGTPGMLSTWDLGY